MHRYQGAAIIHGVRTSVESMMRAFRQKPHFLPMATEVPFGTPDESGRTEIPPILIRTSDGDTVAFSGRIDRIDVLETEDGKKYFLIVDNKMSNKEVKQNSIAAGLQLQLPLYILAAQKGLEGYEAAGGLYQPVRDVLVDSEDRDHIEKQIDKELQTSGMIRDIEIVLEAAKSVKISGKSGANDTVSVVSAEELLASGSCALDTATDSVNRIRSGEVSPRPVKDGMDSPCSWCDHLNGCKYDVTIPGCKILEIDHKRRVIIQFGDDETPAR